MSSIAQEIEQLIGTAWDLQNTRYIALLAYTAAAYDIIITQEQERALVWNAKWSKGKILFFLVRYLILFEASMYVTYLFAKDIGATFCIAASISSGWFTVCCLIPLQAIVILRTSALWERSKGINFLLIGSVIAADIVMIVTTVRIENAVRHHIDDSVVRPIIGCLSYIPPLNLRLTFPAWISMIAFDSLIFLLTIMKAVRNYIWGMDRAPLITVLIRDGFLYYAVMLAAAILNVLFYDTLGVSHPILSSSLTTVVNASCSIIGSRLMLNMHGAVSRADGVQGLGSSHLFNFGPGGIRFRSFKESTNAGTELVEASSRYDGTSSSDRQKDSVLA